ncbi:MAG: tRNA uracil 4-sulfurtransferase ThiI [Anaerolineae bacterium]|jgi:thiamine biosynthesis protein ThiI
MGLILIRYSGEIGIKGKNRHYFVKRLRHNLRDALKRHDIEGKVWSEGQRVYAEVDDEARDAALSAFTRVFGIASVSPVERVPSDLAVIRAQALALAERAGLDPSMSFRVQTRRADKAFPYISPEVNRLVGSTIYEAMHARVDLSDSADVTIGIEIRSQGTLIYGQVLPGQGGLPLGSQGRVFVLLSGGIDSPVAAWLMMRRGCGVIPLHFSQNEIEREKALANCQVLERWSYGWQIKPIVLDQGELLEPVIDQLVEMGKERWICVFCKRAMIARAAQLAPAYRVQALVMGDSLGQVASQTLGNLAAISYEAELPILRPLIGYNKVEIMDLARRIGTFEVSTQDAAGCRFLPDRPVTSADLAEFKELLSRLV